MKTLQKLLSPILIATVCMSALASAADGNELDARPVISIWPAGTAGVDPSVAEEFHKQKSIYVKTIHNPTLTVFRPENPNGVAVVICPGGGYTFLSFENEGKRIAEKLNKSGITAFVLKYRLPTTQGADFKHPVPLSDALRAIQWIRGHATEYKLIRSGLASWVFRPAGIWPPVLARCIPNTASEPMKSPRSVPALISCVWAIR